MSDKLQSAVADAIAPMMGPPMDELPKNRIEQRHWRRHGIDPGHTQSEVREIAAKAIAITLQEVEAHLQAVQYDPAPYTALKTRLRSLIASTMPSDHDGLGPAR